MTNTTDTTSTPQVLTDSRAFARYLLERFTEPRLGATGALLLDENSAPLGVLILEPGPDANLSALSTVFAGALTQIVPFLFRPGLDPMVTDEEIDLFCEFLESPLLDVTVPDAIYVWDTGHYIARANAGGLANIYDTEDEGGARCLPA